MKTLLMILFLLVGSSVADAAIYTLTWEQPGDITLVDDTRIERAAAPGKTCGVFSEIATVAPTVLTYVDATAPPGIVCYRARNARTITAPEGPIVEFSPYSNVAAAPRVAPPKNLQSP